MVCSCKGDPGQENIFSSPAVDLSLLDKVIAGYENQEGSLISILQKTQEIYGYLPGPALLHVAQVLKVKPAKVYGVATFYTQFRLKPAGKHLILLCQGTACHVNGAEHIGKALCEELKIRCKETTDDLLFTLDTAACLGCCSLAPVMMINGQVYGHLTPESARQIIRDIYRKEQKNSGEGDRR